MKSPLLLSLAFCIGVVSAVAQPANDECTNPIKINTVFNYCSPVGSFTNVGATPSTYGPATCFGATSNDVWFAFTAVATDVTITVRGATAQGAGGTLQDPQIALYFGSCGGTINQLECQSATGSDNIVEAYQGGLFVGSTYLIRIQGSAGQTGTFQICLNNYNPPVEPTSDCPESSILCDKSPFVVQSVTGAGKDIKEMDDASCFANGSPTNYESNSTWFTWTCSKSGTLEFTLTPNAPADDLDFALYRLPNGLANCAGKQLVRCMASGDNVFPSKCMGPTGLKAGDTDISEDAGCQQADDDAWLAPFNMVAGESYALVVNNYTSTGNGFAVEWGGSGEFLGPQAAFNTLPPAVCLGTAVQVIDASTFPIGAITGWKWSFGADAVPQTATGPGPHTVAFNIPGDRPVVLTLETDLGCKVTDIQTVKIFPDVEVDTLIAAPDCNGTKNGAVKINNIVSGTPPYQFSWNNGPFGTTDSLTNVGPGIYTLKIKDSNNCETDLEIEVKERVLTALPDIDKPLCFGDANGVVTMNVTNGKAPVQFNWGNGFIFQNTQSGFPAGVYTVQAVDAVLCKGSFSVTVTDNPPLELELDTVSITCKGLNDGSAMASPAGGVGNFNYKWSDNQSTAEAENLGPGAYSVTVSDGNNCTIVGNINLVEPPPVDISLVDVKDLLCNGVPTGEIQVEGSGGRTPYVYSADGVDFQSSGVLTGLPAGNYWVQMKDASGCRDSVQAAISQPLPLEVIAAPSDTTLELGFPLQISSVSAPFGRPVTYTWIPSDNLSCPDCPNPLLTAVDDQLLVVTIRDEDGCTDEDTVRIRVRKERPVYFPNIFKPGSSELNNDHFTGFGGPAVAQITLLRIYDRWGSLVFEAKNIDHSEPALGWDGEFRGKPVDGVFAWYAVVRFVDQVEIPYEGSITVLR